MLNSLRFHILFIKDMENLGVNIDHSFYLQKYIFP